MGIYVSDIRVLIIKPCLVALGEYSIAAENLLTGTASLESQGQYCAGTPGLGIYQITASKHRELWDNYLVQFPDLASTVRGFASQQQFFRDPHGELVGNLHYATAMAWMIYRAAGVAPGEPADLHNIAQLWARHFDNGVGCLRNPDNFIANYRDQLLDSDERKLVA